MKKFLVSVLLTILKGLRNVGKVIRLLFLNIAKLLNGIWKIFRPLFIRVYKLYLVAFNRLKKTLGIKKRFGFLFANKYIVHVVIVILALFISSTNIIQAKEIRSEEFQKKTPLAEVVQPEIGDDEEIVETAESIKKVGRYIDTSASLVANIPVLEEEGEHDELITAGSGSALVKTNILETGIGYSTDIREHEVMEGETISTIAEDYSVSVATIQWANNLGSSTVIKPGDTLKILPVSGVVYTVESGDTLLDIVTKHKGDIDEVKDMNGIDDDDLVAVGTEIVIPGGSPYVAPKPQVSTPTTSYDNTSGGWTSVFKPSTEPAAPSGGGQFIWPSASHDISQYSRWGHVAVDVRGPMGTAIYASAGGVATLHSGGGYGNYIIVDHQNGWSTLYAHLSSYAVSSGQYVSQGQVIGGEGSTGWSTGPHLHFEIRQGGTKYNPLQYVSP